MLWQLVILAKKLYNKQTCNGYCRGEGGGQAWSPICWASHALLRFMLTWDAREATLQLLHATSTASFLDEHQPPFGGKW